jgi:hypothetical protein
VRNAVHTTVCTALYYSVYKLFTTVCTALYCAYEAFETVRQQACTRR